MLTLWSLGLKPWQELPSGHQHSHVLPGTQPLDATLTNVSRGLHLLGRAQHSSLFLLGTQYGHQGYEKS